MFLNCKKLIQAFEKNNGILTTEMAKENEIDKMFLEEEVKRKNILEYSEGIYLLDDWYADDLYLLQLKYPESIYSHYTAIMLHWLSTDSPFIYHLSFPEDYHLQKLENNIKAYSMNSNEFTDEYITKLDSWHSNFVRVTNLEKTIVDIFRNEKLMTFVIQEMIDDYIDREDKNIKKLIEYAERFNVLEVVKSEILPFI